MLNKIKKPLSAICMMVVIGLLTCGFVYAKANPDSLQFTGKNNTEVTLFADKDAHLYACLPHLKNCRTCSNFQTINNLWQLLYVLHKLLRSKYLLRR